MRSGAERESRIESHDDCVRVLDGLVARTDPQTFTKSQRMKVLEPFTFPGAIRYLARLNAGRCESQPGDDHARDLILGTVRSEQCLYSRGRPKAKFSR